MAVEGWQNRSLDDLGHYYNGRAFKPEDWSKQGLPIIRIAQITNPKAELDYYEGADVEEKHLIDNDDLIFSWSATLTAVKWDRGPAILNQHLFKVVEKSGIDRDYLRYLILNSIDALVGHSHGSTMKHIKRGVLKDFRVDVPPFYEQKKIAEILISVDEAIAKTEAIIAQTQKVKQGLLQTLLTKGIGHTKFKQTEIGEIPKGWVVKDLGELTNKITKGESPRWQGFEYQDEGVLFVTSENVRDGHIDISFPKFIPEAFGEKLFRSKLEHGDVLVNLVGASIGRAAIWRAEYKEANINQAVATVRPKRDEILPEIVLGVLYSKRGQGYFGLSKVDSARPNVSLSNLRDFPVAVPPIEEQKEIVEIINNIGQLENAQINYFSKLKALKKGLMSDLLTGRVRVKLDKKSEKAA